MVVFFFRVGEMGLLVIFFLWSLRLKLFLKLYLELLLSNERLPFISIMSALSGQKSYKSYPKSNMLI
jgi:hypothetical protein